VANQGEKIDENVDETIEPTAEERARALIEATHQFPCEYALTVIAFNSHTVTTALKGAVASGRDSIDHQVRESSAGKYLSHRFSVSVNGAHAVLELYAVVRAIEGVVTIL
jgi:putative lipoic acid-binding regulatory protein